MRADRVDELKVIFGALNRGDPMTIWCSGEEIKDIHVRTRAGGGVEIFILPEADRRAAEGSRQKVKAARKTRGIRHEH